MTIPQKPAVRPANPCFSSGPCTKRPGWTLENLNTAFLGRSHRHKDGIARIQEVLDRTRSILGIPDDYHVGMVPGSDTGAFEMALWNMLGARGVDVLVWDQFGGEWRNDAVNQLKIEDLRALEAPFGEIPDLAAVDFDRDVVFTWNGTTAGVMVPGGDWIAGDRQGLTFCDATSAVFAIDLPWDKLDVVSWSWQKVMGGEAAHGMLVLSPRAVARIESYDSGRPIPKVFRLKKNGQFFDEPFRAFTLNTPSMLCVEDALDGLKWAEDIGGGEALRARSRANYEAIAAWVDRTPWVDYLAADAAIRSTTSVTLKVVDPAFDGLDPDDLRKTIRGIGKLVDEEGAGYDFNEHRAAPPGFRIWAGATVETADLEALFPWIEWAFHKVRAEILGEAA